MLYKHVHCLCEGYSDTKTSVIKNRRKSITDMRRQTKLSWHFPSPLPHLSQKRSLTFVQLFILSNVGHLPHSSRKSHSASRSSLTRRWSPLFFLLLYHVLLHFSSCRLRVLFPFYMVVFSADLMWPFNLSFLGDPRRTNDRELGE